MSQEQPNRPQSEQEPVKLYDDDVVEVSDNLGVRPVAPTDPAPMQPAVVNSILGQIPKGWAASVVQPAAVGSTGGVAITGNDTPGRRIVTESVGEQVVGQYSQPVALAPVSTFQHGNITIGEALEATALISGGRAVDYSDAAAIQAAEVRATGRTNIIPGGVAAAAQSAATRNARTPRDQDKTKLADILSDATAKLPADKAVTRRDAEGVIGAELRNDPNLTTRPGGVAASVAAAARLNQSK